MSVASAWDQVRVADSDIKDHLPTFVKLVENLDAQRVIELGVRWGTSAVAWLYGLERTGGHLWGVDINPPPFSHRRMTFIQGYDCAPSTLDALPELADIIFVDTSHHYVQTQMEIDIFSRRVSPGGCLVLHDVAVETFDHHTAADDQPPYPVRRAVIEAVAAHGWECDWTEVRNGLAVIWP